MRTTNTFSILFWIYETRAKNDLANIYVRITVNGKKVNLSLKQKVLIQNWNKEKQRAKGKDKVSQIVNQHLDQTHSKLVEIYQELKFKDKYITAELIKASYLGEGDNFKTLQNIIDYHKKKTERTLTSGTIRNFGVTESYLNQFLNRELKVTDVYLKQLDYRFICDFEHFLHTYWPKGHPKAMGHNTVMKHVQRFRKIVTLAYHLEWMERDPFLRWKSTFERTERQFLNEGELSNIRSYKFLIDRLDRARDLFVFSCYTGISYADIAVLTPDHVHKGIDGYNWIVTKRKKTKTPFKIPLLDEAQELVEKYRNHPITQVSGKLLPVITNEKLNLYLKEIADACGIKKNLTFHMARHTFATTVTLSNGVPIETVSKLLGHTKIATTQIYARVLEHKVSEDMKTLRARINQQSDKDNRDIRNSTG